MIAIEWEARMHNFVLDVGHKREQMANISQTFNHLSSADFFPRRTTTFQLLRMFVHSDHFGDQNFVELNECFKITLLFIINQSCPHG